jgi:hypothetical protein
MPGSVICSSDISGRRPAGLYGTRGGGGVERQLGGRRIRKERLDPVEVRHFQRGELLAQHRFERVFPARLDMYLLPETRQLGQPMALQPRLNLAVGLHVLLQLSQRGETGFQRSDRRGLALHALLRGAAFAVQARHRLLAVHQHGLRFLEQRFLLGQIHAQFFQAHFVRAIQALSSPCSRSLRCSSCCSIWLALR